MSSGVPARQPTGSRTASRPGRSTHFRSESHPQRPEDAYGSSKVVGEIIAERTVRHYSVSVASLQPSWIQVPGAYGTAPVRRSFDLADPTQSGSLWSYVDVRDAARMVRCALETDLSGHEAAFSSAKARRELGWEPAHSWRVAETERVDGPEVGG
jgi:UDP-glucose 4-epimerase